MLIIMKKAADEAQLQGIHLLGTNIAMLCVVALTVIVLTQVVGLILVIALLPSTWLAVRVARTVERMPPPAARMSR